MHYAWCAVSAVLSNSPVLFCPVQPVHFCVFVSKIRSENKFAILFDSGLNFGVARLRGWAAEEKEEDDEDEEEELRISWVVFCGWRECRCGEARVKLGLKVLGGWVLWKEKMEAAGKPGLAVDLFFSLCLCLSGSGWVGEWVLMNGSHVAATEDFLVW